MIRKLCVRSLQRGVGSMDHIYTLLIMEDEDDSDQEDDQHGGQKPTSVTEICYKTLNVSLEELKNIKTVLF